MLHPLGMVSAQQTLRFTNRQLTYAKSTHLMTEVFLTLSSFDPARRDYATAHSLHKDFDSNYVQTCFSLSGFQSPNSIRALNSKSPKMYIRLIEIRPIIVADGVCCCVFHLAKSRRWMKRAENVQLVRTNCLFLAF